MPDNKNKKKDAYVLFKPYISRLFTYIVLLYLAMNTFDLYTGNYESYKDFLDYFEEPLLTDIKFVTSNETCPNNYTDIRPTTFPQTLDGCLCDGMVLKLSQCKLFKNQANRTCGTKDFFVPGVSDFTIPSNNNQSNLWTCNDCYTQINTIPEELPIRNFYSDKRICLFYDQSQTTTTYIKSAGSECYPENICNEFFCKLNNDKNNKCPITFLSNSIQNLTQPFAFSNGYIQYKDYDSNYHGYINAPVTDIAIGRGGMCSKQESTMISNYPLMPIDFCHPSSMYQTFDSALVSDVLKANSYNDYLNQSLPFYFNFTYGEAWSIQARTTFAYQSLYCIINKYLLFSENTFTIISNETIHVLDKETSLEKFKEMMYVFHHLSENHSFQHNVQYGIL